MIPLPSLDYDYLLADHPFTDSKQTRKPGRPRKRSKSAEPKSKQKKETSKERKVRVRKQHKRFTTKDGLAKANRAFDSPKKDSFGKVLAESKILNTEFRM